MTDLNQIQKHLDQALLEVPDLGVTVLGDLPVLRRVWHDPRDPAYIGFADLCTLRGRLAPLDQAMYTAMYITKALMSLAEPMDK